MNTGERRGRFAFEEFLLDIDEGELRRDGVPLKLTPKAFDTLAVLVENAPRLVDRNSLMRQVWPDAVVEEANLANNISLLRRVLEEPAGAARFIQTVPRRGYRFVAPVRRIEEEGAVTSEPPPSEQRPHPRTLWLLGGAVLLLLGAVVVVAMLARHRPAREPHFEQLTFRQGLIGSARFAPDGSVIYDAAWEGNPIQIFAANVGNPAARTMDWQRTALASVSREGTLALIRNPESMLFRARGSLSRAEISGGEPRTLLANVQEADWLPDGERLAVIGWEGSATFLEFPIGRRMFVTQQPGWLSHLRLSPNGELAAFLVHPVERWDDHGYAVIVDRSGRTVARSDDYESIFGLAWSPDGSAIFYTASRSDLNNALYSMSLAGEQRQRLQIAGRLQLHDIAPDGRFLVTRENGRDGMVAVAGDGRERDLSYLDGSWLRDLSPDGGTILFDEEANAGGKTGTVYLRGVDGSAPVPLCRGNAVALAPDGTTVLVRERFAKPPRFVLSPTGAGEPRPLSIRGVDLRESARWIPDGTRIAMVGAEPGRPPRTFMVDPAASTARPITPEGTIGRLVSPDGRNLLARSGNRLVVADIASGSVREIPAAEPEEQTSGWSGNDAVFVHRRNGAEITRARIELASGRRTPLPPIVIHQTGGLLGIGPVVVSADGKVWAYGYHLQQSELFIVDSIGN